MIQLTNIVAVRIAARMNQLKMLRKEQYAQKLSETNNQSDALNLIIELENEMFSIDCDIKHLKP